MKFLLFILLILLTWVMPIKLKTKTTFYVSATLKEYNTNFKETRSEDMTLILDYWPHMDEKHISFLSAGRMPFDGQIYGFNGYQMMNRYILHHEDFYFRIRQKDDSL
jgi:hypothetical protein